MVVSEAMITGRTREMVASMTARSGSMRSSVCNRLISSTSTMAFFTIIPTKPITPMMAMNVNGWRKRSNAGTMPQMTKGKHIKMSKTFFQLLNKSRRARKTMKAVIGTNFSSPPIDSSCNSPSPTQRRA